MTSFNREQSQVGEFGSEPNDNDVPPDGEETPDPDPDPVDPVPDPDPVVVPDPETVLPDK